MADFSSALSDTQAGEVEQALREADAGDFASEKAVQAVRDKWLAPRPDTP